MAINVVGSPLITKVPEKELIILIMISRSILFEICNKGVGRILKSHVPICIKVIQSILISKH